MVEITTYYMFAQLWADKAGLQTGKPGQKTVEDALKQARAEWDSKPINEDSKAGVMMIRVAAGYLSGSADPNHELFAEWLKSNR